MRSFHEVLIEAASRPGVSAASRRSVFALAAAAPLAFGLEAVLAKNPGRKKQQRQKRRKTRSADNTPAPPPASQPTPAATPSDIAILNYALTLEHLEYAFYRDALAAGGFNEKDFKGYLDPNLYERLLDIRDHERTHVEALTATIQQLGGEPVEELRYDFGYDTAREFLEVAQALENTGVSAYQGAAQFLIDEDELLTAALTIHGVEARHAAYLNGLQGESPFPDAVNPTLTPDEVLAIAGPFIVS